MSKEEYNKTIVGRWFTDFRGTNVKLAVIDEIAAPDMHIRCTNLAAAVTISRRS